MASISLEGVSKTYRIFPRRRDRLKEALSFGRITRSHEFQALKGVDLEVEAGTALGVLGRNGAGKSTLLKIVSGVLQPTSGKVEIDGRLAALLQLGAGFNVEFTGRENVMLNGLILGMDRRKTLERFDEIAAFADIGEFMDQPVKTYSSGMRARLGFAVAVNVEPEILIVDEVLAVGDEVFRQMCVQKMRDLRDSGTTILFVSHNLGMVKNFCSESMLLHRGEVVAAGDTSETIDRYQALLSSIEARKGLQVGGDAGPVNYSLEEEMPSFKENPDLERRRSRLRHGTGEARISSVELLDEHGKPTDLVNPELTVTARVHLKYEKTVRASTLSITLRNRAGLDVFSTDTNLEKAPIRKRAEGERIIVDFTFEMPLQQGSYSLTVAVYHPQSTKIYLDWVDVATVFEILPPKGRWSTQGLVHLPTRVEIHSPDRERQSETA